MVVYFGTAGIPLSAADGNTNEGIRTVKRIGLDAMELEFVRSVYLKKEDEINKVRKTAKKENVKLSVHAPYYINLNSNEKRKVEASIKRIIDSARVAHYAGATSVVIHSAYYMKMEKEQVYRKVKRKYKELEKIMNEEGLKVILRPELMGKHTQFGNLNELLKLSNEVEGVLPCIDFAHYEARYGEDANCYEGFCRIFEQMESRLGKQALKNVHIHFSAVEYVEKGERRHLTFNDGQLKWKDMVRCWKDYKLKGVAISESPNIEVDALKAKKHYLSL